MPELDQTARFALKMAPEENLRWLLPKLDADLMFTRWLDTETIAFPGEPRRRCDTVAELVSRSRRAPPWAVVMEVEERARASIVDRLLEYVARLLRKLRHGPRRRDRYRVAAVLIDLTGTKRRLVLDMQLEGTDVGMVWRVGGRTLARESAPATLAQIAAGEIGRTVLRLVPLMKQGGDEGVIAEWTRLASQESEQRRSDLAGVVKVFAEKAGHLPAWKQALEGLKVTWKSRVIDEWRKEGFSEGEKEGKMEGQIETCRRVLLRAFPKRFKVEVPADLAQIIEKTTDLEVLARWVDEAMTANSADDLRKTIQPAPPSAN
jgi:hypothetical protein